MLRKYGMMTGLLLLVLLLGACKKSDNQGLPTEQADTQSYEKETSSEEEASFEKEASQKETSDLPEDQDLAKGESEHLPTIEPVITEQPDYTIDNETEGALMEAEDQSSSGDFYFTELTDEVKTRISGKSYKENCDISYDELRYVRVLYWGFDDETHRGELIVNKAIAEDIVDIMKELYDQKYPIEQMVLVDEYDADDNTSMAADNTSSFNYRNVDGTNHLSLHSYGLAIDINPLYNPYVRGNGDNMVITPENGTEYANRTLECSYFIEEGDICYKAFTDRGFTWGGEWKNQKDYQHFQKTIE